MSEHSLAGMPRETSATPSWRDSQMIITYSMIGVAAAPLIIGLIVALL